MSIACGVGAVSRPWRHALAWLLFLGPFFFLSYGLANAYAAQHANVRSIAFGWEARLPFWAWTILPYWSLDALYAISLFACRSRRELDMHAKRLLTAQVVAVTCFLALPLRFSFDRPVAEGPWDALFAALGAFDRPFNQLPSLHIALAIIVWSAYARVVSGVPRAALACWFLLIGASVLTTYQHHFIDVPTGALLGALCVWLWPFDAPSIVSQGHWARDHARWRLASIYAGGAVLFGAVAITASGWALWLLWPGVSLTLVALAYAAIGPGAFQKARDGRLATAARWLLAPYLAGAWINSRVWTWRDRRAAPIAEDVHLGPLPGKLELASTRYATIIDLTGELSSAHSPCALTVVPMLDLVQPSREALARAAEAIERARGRGPVLVCCALGRSRGACAVAAWLLITGRAADPAAALQRVRVACASVVVDHRHVAALAALYPT